MTPTYPREDYLANGYYTFGGMTPAGLMASIVLLRQSTNVSVRGRRGRTATTCSPGYRGCSRPFPPLRDARGSALSLPLGCAKTPAARLTLGRRRRSHDHHHDQPLGTRIAQRVILARLSKHEVTRPDVSLLVSDPNLAVSREDEIELVLSRVRVQLVFLSGLERIQTGEKMLSGQQVRLAHFLGAEDRFGNRVFDDHSRARMSHELTAATSLRSLAVLNLGLQLRSHCSINQALSGAIGAAVPAARKTHSRRRTVAPLLSPWPRGIWRDRKFPGECELSQTGSPRKDLPSRACRRIPRPTGLRKG